MRKLAYLIQPSSTKRHFCVSLQPIMFVCPISLDCLSFLQPPTFCRFLLSISVLLLVATLIFVLPFYPTLVSPVSSINLRSFVHASSVVPITSFVCSYSDVPHEPARG